MPATSATSFLLVPQCGWATPTQPQEEEDEIDNLEPAGTIESWSCDCCSSSNQSTSGTHEATLNGIWGRTEFIKLSFRASWQEQEQFKGGNNSRKYDNIMY